MRVAIIDTNYKNQKFQGLAATWLRWEAQRAKVSVTDVSDADFILMTVSSQQGLVQVRSWRRRVPTNKIVILGGGGCYAPAIFKGLANVICVGEGQRFIHTLFEKGIDAVKQLPETWLFDETRDVIPSQAFPFDCPPLCHPDGTIRVWGSRGCKRKCFFCQTGWEREYLQNPSPNLVRLQIRSLKNRGHKVAVITNDGAADNYDGELGQQEFVSVTAHQLEKIRISRAYAKSIRIGVEGVSERLRRAVGKPITNTMLSNATIKAWRAGVGVRWFFVAGLPCETELDWLELRELIDMIRHERKGVVMMNFHAFIPQPATPLGILPVVDDYWERFDEFRRWFFHGPGFTRRVQIVSPAKYQGRMKRAIESMSATEAEIRRGWFNHDNENWRIKYVATPEKLRQLAQIYMEKYK